MVLSTITFDVSPLRKTVPAYCIIMERTGTSHKVQRCNACSHIFDLHEPCWTTRISRYNSAFFSSLSTNNYNILIVTEDFLHGADVGSTTAFNGNWTSNGESIPHYAHSIQGQVHAYEKLNKTECMGAYMVEFVTNQGTLVIVANYTSHDGTSVIGGANYEYQAPGSIDFVYNPYYWYVAT